MSGNGVSPETLDAFRKFLEYGPIGIVGLMLLLVIFAIMLKDLTPALERTLKTFMIVGVICFGAALAAQVYAPSGGTYPLHFTVLPNDLDNSVLPPPLIKINGARVDPRRAYVVSGESTAQIDVSRALDQAARADRTIRIQTAQIAKKDKALKDVAQVADKLMLQLRTVPQAATPAPSGGATGTLHSLRPMVTIRPQTLTTLQTLKVDALKAANGQ